MKKVVFPSLFLILSLVLFNCHKIEHISDIPNIEYTSFTIFDTTDILGNYSKGGLLQFKFEDGDGDLGLASPTITDVDSTNLFFTLYRKENGVLVQAPENDPLNPSDYRIPYMTRLGHNKILKGTISVTFLYLFYEPTDTIVYEFYIKDRANHDSNTIMTNEIVINENKVY
jgi:hypothetical protein